MLKETLKELCALRGPSGSEEEVRNYLKSRLKNQVESMKTDAVGNLICFKKGKLTPKNSLMVCAHMDEVGLMVTHIDDGGYLRFQPIGGIDRRVLLGKPVLVGPQAVPGVIGVKAIHLTKAKDRENLPDIKELCIDIGAKDKNDARRWAAPGDVVTFLPENLEFGEGYFKSKAIDDRIGCAIMVELMEGELPVDCTFVFTVQEEIGTRGAFGSAFSVKPDIAMALEGTTAADLPSMPPSKKVCSPGCGPVISLMDRSAIYDRALFEELRDLAEQNGIPWQAKHYLAGGTDAGSIQRSRSGVRVCGISAAVRYLHAPTSVASLSDFENMLALARLFLKNQGESR